MARQESAATIINRTAVEVGLAPVADPFASSDGGFSQLTGLLNIAGLELLELRPWQELNKRLTFNTGTDLVSNVYTLPDDYDRLIPQTAWDLTNDVPVIGPLSPQDWAFLLGRDLASNSIYIAYRILGGNLEFFPTTVPVANLSFEYISRNWASNAAGSIEKDFCDVASDIVKLDPTLMQKFLKVKYLSAKGMPTADAKVEFENVLQNRMGNDAQVPILNAGRNARGFPYLSAANNTPDTNFGF